MIQVIQRSCKFIYFHCWYYSIVPQFICSADGRGLFPLWVAITNNTAGNILLHRDQCIYVHVQRVPLTAVPRSGMLPRRVCKTSTFLHNTNGFPKEWYQFAPASAVCVSLLIPLFFSGLSFDHCAAESLPYPWKSGFGAPLWYFFSTYAHLIMTLVIPCNMHMTDVRRSCSDP